jgi:hypothetical protein
MGSTFSDQASSSSSTHISNCSGSAPRRNLSMSAARVGLGFQTPPVCSASVISLSSGSESLRFVRPGGHNSATDGDWPPQWVEELLNRGVEGVQVRMKYGGRTFHADDHPPYENAREHQGNNGGLVKPGCTGKARLPQACVPAATGRVLSRTCVRCIRRRNEGSSSFRRCRVHRLSQITRSP